MSKVVYNPIEFKDPYYISNVIKGISRVSER